MSGKKSATKHPDGDILSDDNASYDQVAKHFLARKRLLAFIIQHLIPEFQQVSRKAIEEKYILGTPQVSEVPVNPGETNQPSTSSIRGFAQEHSDEGEGKITFDILFYAKLPQKGEVVKFIINLEAQKAIPKDYPLLKRVMFYGCRLISSQKERDFDHSDYGRICKVYTIWLCFTPPQGYGSGINLYTMGEKHVRGNYHEQPENYQLLNAVVVYVGDHNTGNKLLNLLRLIFKQNLSGKEKRQLLNQKYDMQLTSTMGKELESMCNLSEGIYERGEANGIVIGEAKGEARGISYGRDLEKQSTVERLSRKGWKLADIADATDWTIEQVKSFLQSKKIQIS